MNCPVCQSCESDQIPAGALSGLPVIAHALSPTKERACSIPRGDIELSCCTRCGHFFNRCFDPNVLEYDASYENSLEHSPRFRAYLDELVHTLVERLGLSGRSVLEIGCGQANFLRALGAAGGNQCVGFDPCHASAFEEPLQRGGRLRVEPGLFTPGRVDAPVDFVACRHVLEHLENPTKLLRDIRKILCPKGALYFEVPNARWIVRDRSVWDLLYEHCSYFTHESLSFLCAANGFRASYLGEAYGSQFLQLEAHKLETDNGSAETGVADALRDLAVAFADAVDREVERWNLRLNELAGAGNRIAIWGAGSKTVTFLNAVKAAAQVAAVVDLNPRKHDMYIAGSGHPIVAKEALRDLGITHVLLMNPLYTGEIRADCLKIDAHIKLEAVV